MLFGIVNSTFPTQMNIKPIQAIEKYSLIHGIDKAKNYLKVGIIWKIGQYQIISNPV